MHRHVAAVFVMLSVVIILVTMHYSVGNTKITWQQLPQQKKLAEEKGILVRGRKVAWCRCVSRGTSLLGTKQASLPVPPAKDVPRCCGQGMERVWPCHLPRLARAITRGRSWDRVLCHRAHLPHLNKAGDCRDLLGHIPAAKVPWGVALWWGDRGASPSRNFTFH